MSKNNENAVFAGSRVTAEGLENHLLDTLLAVKSKKMDPTQANPIIAAAKEICNISRLRLQYRLLAGAEAAYNTRRIGNFPSQALTQKNLKLPPAPSRDQ